MDPEIIQYGSAAELARKLADSISLDISKKLDEGKTPLLILPGGSSPCTLISELARKELPWNDIRVTTTDERCVPLDNDASNAGQIKRLFGAQGTAIEPLPLWDQGRVSTRVFDELDWPATTTVLGMGLDAHIASLFPGYTFSSTETHILETIAPFEPHARVSLSMRELINTKNLILLVIGREKHTLCEGILSGKMAETPLAQLMNIAGNKLSLHIVNE